MVLTMVLRSAHFALLAVLAAPLTLVGQAPAPVAVPTSAATPVVMPPAPLLPDGFGEWKVSGSADNALTIAPDVQKELITTRQDAKKYGAEGNAATVSAMEFTDATGAYSAFTLLRTLEMRPCGAANNLGKDCAVAAGKLLFWQGDTVVLIVPTGTKPMSASSFNELVGMLPKPSGAKAALPLLPTKLTQDGLEKESLRYAVGPLTYAAQGGGIPASVIDFSKSPEILTARYTGGKTGHGVLTMIFYPTPTIAGDRMRAIQKAVEDKTLSAGMLTGEPAAARSGPIVAFASSGFTAKQAQKLAEGVKYQAAITWDKPEGYMDQLKVKAAASVMVQIMIFVFVMAGAALALGIVFGGGRAAFRLSRGKPISSLDDMEVISLGLRGRPDKPLR
jgi:hypothetical protein